MDLPNDAPATDRTDFLAKPKYSEFLRTWHVPLSQDQRTLREAYESLMSIGNSSEEVPLVVRLAENPEYHFSGLGFFKGRVTLQQHDFIHVVLGRGTTLIDEAFVIGFTMGSTDRVSTTEASIFSAINQLLYPKPYRFTKTGTKVFKDAVALAFVSDCQSLDRVDFAPMLDWPLCQIRAEIGLETDLLRAYYSIEARRYPENRASQRLLN